MLTEPPRSSSVGVGAARSGGISGKDRASADMPTRALKAECFTYCSDGSAREAQGESAASEEVAELAFDELREPRAIAASGDLDEERLEVITHDGVEHRLLAGPLDVCRHRGPPSQRVRQEPGFGWASGSDVSTSRCVGEIIMGARGIYSIESGPPRDVRRSRGTNCAWKRGASSNSTWLVSGSDCAPTVPTPSPLHPI